MAIGKFLNSDKLVAMTLSRSWLFALLFLALALPAQAQQQGPLTAVQLQQMCVSRYDVDAGMCAGYVMAIADQLQHETEPLYKICLTPAITPQTLIDNLQRIWKDQPPQSNEMAFSNVTGALRGRFRCP